MSLPPFRSAEKMPRARRVDERYASRDSRAAAGRDPQDRLVTFDRIGLRDLERHLGRAVRTDHETVDVARRSRGLLQLRNGLPAIQLEHAAAYDALRAHAR